MTSSQRGKRAESKAKTAKANEELSAARPSSMVSLLSAHWDKFLGAIVVAVATAVGVWLEPLKDLVLHTLYQERASLALLIEPPELQPGGTLSVRIRITPGPHIELADGIVKLTYDPQVLTLSPNTTDSFNAKKSSQARILEEGIFSLYSKEFKETTNTEILATYATKYGTYTSAPVVIQLTPHRTDTVRPFIERSGSKAINLSGEWRIQLGASVGNMRITQDSRDDIKGEYMFNGNLQNKMIVDGYKDGTSFKVFFWRDIKGDQRWFIDANFAVNPQDPRFLEMKGCAFQISKDSNITHDSLLASPDICAKRDFVGWRGVGASTFYSTAQMR